MPTEWRAVCDNHESFSVDLRMPGLEPVCFRPVHAHALQRLSAFPGLRRSAQGDRAEEGTPHPPRRESAGKNAIFAVHLEMCKSAK